MVRPAAMSASLSASAALSSGLSGSSSSGRASSQSAKLSPREAMESRVASASCSLGSSTRALSFSFAVRGQVLAPVGDDPYQSTPDGDRVQWSESRATRHALVLLRRARGITRTPKARTLPGAYDPPGSIVDRRTIRLLVVLSAWALICGACPSLGGASQRATWMGGPGCGGAHEWRQHPVSFPYFCDGAALVERAHGRNWAKATATARATMKEADLGHGASVGTAPRIHSAITVIATHIETCGGRRAYTLVSIRFDKPHRGQRT